MGRGIAFGVQFFGSFYHFVASGADRKYRYFFAITYLAPLANRYGLHRAAPVYHHTVAAGVTDHKRAHIILLGGVHQVSQLFLVHRRQNYHVRDATHISKVISAVMGWPVGAGNACAIEAKYHVKFLDGYVMYHLVVRPLHKAGVDITERDQTLCGQTC